MKHQLEEKIRAAFTHAAPAGDLDALLARVGEAHDERRVIRPRPKKPARILRRLSAAAAALALVIGGALAVRAYNVNYRVDTTVSLDVNPSIELTANRRERVLGARALNADGEALLEGMALAGRPLDAALGSLVGTMLERGYLDADEGAILLSVFGRDAARTASVESHLSDGMATALADTKVSLTVQTVEADEAIRALAAQYAISVGKAQYVSRVAEHHQEYGVEELAAMNIKQLYRIRAGLSPEAPVVAETVISAEEAKAIALEHAAEKMAKRKLPFDPAAITNYSCTLELQQVGPVHFCYFENDTHNFSVRINATTGEIYHFSQENWFMKNESEALRPEFLRLALADVGLTSDKVSGVAYMLSENRYDEETMAVGFYDKAKTTYYRYVFGMRSRTLLDSESRPFKSSDEPNNEQRWANVIGTINPATGAYFTKEDAHARALAAALTDLGLHETDITLCESKYVFCTAHDAVSNRHIATCALVEFDWRGVHFAYRCAVFEDFRIIEKQASPAIRAEAVYGADGMLTRESAVTLALAANGYTLETATLIDITDVAAMDRPDARHKQVMYYDNGNLYRYTVEVDLHTGAIARDDRARLTSVPGVRADLIDETKMTFAIGQPITDDVLAVAQADLGLRAEEMTSPVLQSVAFAEQGGVYAAVEFAAKGNRYVYTCDIRQELAIIDKTVTPIG